MVFVDLADPDNSPKTFVEKSRYLSIIADNIRIQWDELKPLRFDKTGDYVGWFNCPINGCK